MRTLELSEPFAKRSIDSTFGCRPASVDLDGSTLRPPELPEFLPKRRDPGPALHDRSDHVVICQERP